MDEMKLIEILRAKDKGDKLFYKLEEIKARAEPLLAKITETFSEYTIHDIRHSEKVLEKLDEVLIPDVPKGKMNAYEIFFLIASAYLHDIGMVDFPELVEKHKEEFEEFAKKEKLKNPEISDEEAKRRFIREHHHTRSEEYIVEHCKDLDIDDEFQAKIIGRICRGHRKENLSDKEFFDSERAYKTVTINEPLLSAFLRIADELDLDFERAPLMIYEAFKPKDAISQEEWEKNLSVSGVARSKEDLSLIKISATCKSSRVHRALKMLEVKGQDELLKLRDYLHHYKEFHKELPVRIVVDIKPEGYKPYDIKFSLREREITQLLMGEKLYESKDACIRELLQNAVDACRMRRELLKKEGLDYKPEVTFELTSDGKIIVSDNGTGMDEYIVENYFAQMGRCFYTSPDFLSKELGFSPVSRYGIGIISCFMIADKLGIETKIEGSVPLFIEIDKTFDYFFVKEGKRRDVGTTVTLFLKEEVIEEIEEGKFDLKKLVRYYARHLEFPVKVKLPKGKCVPIYDKGYIIDFAEWVSDGWWSKDPERLKGFNSALNKTKEVFQEVGYNISIDEEDIVGTIGISLINLGGRKLTNIAFISNSGIFISKKSSLIPSNRLGGLLFEGLYIDLNIKGEILDLNIPRNDVLRNEKFYKFRSRIEELVINGLKEFIKKFYGKQTPLGPFDFDLFLEGYVISRSGWPGSFINLAREYYYFKVFTKEGIRKMKYEEITKNEKKSNLRRDTTP